MRKFSIMAQEVANLTDARFFASWEVDWLGFNFDFSRPNYVPPQKAAAIREWVEGPAITGMFGLCGQEDIAAVREVLELDAIMVHIFTDPGALSGSTEGIPFFVEVIADSQTDWRATEAMMERWATRTSGFVLDFLKNGIRWEDIQGGKSVPLPWLKDLCSRYPVLPAFDLRPSELRQIADELHPAGFSLRGGEEEKTGFKSFEELEELLEIIEIL